MAWANGVMQPVDPIKAAQKPWYYDHCECGQWKSTSSKHCAECLTDLRSIEKRFWRSVNKKGPNECWLWKDGKCHGYGSFSIGYKSFGAHRIAWLLIHGDIPENQLVLHKCNIPACVNAVSHLYLGTQKDNAADMYFAGRNHSNAGSIHGQAKLTEQQVETIRQALVNSPRGMATRLAAQYGVSTSTIGDIKRGRGWTHIGGTILLDHPNKKLTEGQVREIKRLLGERRPVAGIAKLFAISEGAIHDIKAGRCWRNV